MDLTEFLLARITEDEAWLKASARQIKVQPSPPQEPTRLLAGCEATRRLLAIWPDPLGIWDGPEAAAARAVKDQMRRLLALPYATHPDYRDEWRP